MVVVMITVPLLVDFRPWHIDRWWLDNRVGRECDVEMYFVLLMCRHHHKC